MVKLRNRPDELDIFRLGVYSQIEGNFRGMNKQYRFTFYLQQISDIRQLVNRVIDAQVDVLDKGTYIQFYSKELFNKLSDMGFHKFGTHDWNIPKSHSWSKEFKKEYLRGVIDSLGNVDIDRSSPYIRIQSVNVSGVVSVNKIYGGKLYTSKNSAYLQWWGNDALAICEYLDWIFHCYRNQRGAEIIKNVNWEKFIW